MTALSKYQRLEATALWRASAQGQRREVVVAVGDATLMISDLNDTALAHWSLAALERANPGELPAIYHPDGDPGETLEFAAEEDQMISAIEMLRTAVLRSRPRPGRLRWVGLALSSLAVLALALFWLPGALEQHTLRLVPQVKRAALGRDLLGRIERVAGTACTERNGAAALDRLARRLGVAGRVIVLPAMTRPSLHLPGGLIVLDHSVVEDFEEPDVAAGYILTEATLRGETDPLDDLLGAVGLRENFRMLTTGDIAQSALDGYAEMLMTRSSRAPEPEAQLARFRTAEVRSTPYAFALDATGERTLPLIEGDPMSGQETQPLMSDADWLRLQNICDS